MQKTDFKQHGFTLVEVLLFVLILAVLGFTGYYVYHNQTTKESAAKASTTGTNENSPPQPFVTIKDWGVKVNIDDIDKVTFSAPHNPNGAYGLSANAEFVTISLKSSVTSVAVCQDLGIALYRDKTGPTTKIQTLDQALAPIGNNAGGIVNTMDGYMYALVGKVDACEDGVPDSGQPSALNQLRSNIGIELPSADIEML